MKKILIFILALCVFSAILCSCNYQHQGGDEIMQNNGSLLDENNSDSYVVIEDPPYRHSYAFNSYQEILTALTQKTSNEYLKLREEQINYGRVYQKLLSEFSSNNINIIVPQISESPISLRNKEGYANITLLTSELYNLPWLWYHCIVKDQNLDVKISYLNVIDNLEKKSTTTYKDIIKLIAPNAPSPENYGMYESYETIYEKTVFLKDGVSVTAMISKLKNNSKMYVMFYYDGMLISLFGDNELFNDNFWQSFSITNN